MPTEQKQKVKISLLKEPTDMLKRVQTDLKEIHVKIHVWIQRTYLGFSLTNTCVLKYNVLKLS